MEPPSRGRYEGQAINWRRTSTAAEGYRRDTCHSKTERCGWDAHATRGEKSREKHAFCETNPICAAWKTGVKSL